VKKTRERRIRKLESALQSCARPAAVFRYGPIRYLPLGTGGERHMALAKSESTALANVEHCEFEERMGPSPEAHHSLSFTVYLSAEEQNGNSR
jgi:hypothetical protein